MPDGSNEDDDLFSVGLTLAVVIITFLAVAAPLSAWYAADPLETVPAGTYCEEFLTRISECIDVNPTTETRGGKIIGGITLGIVFGGFAALLTGHAAWSLSSAFRRGAPQGLMSVAGSSIILASLVMIAGVPLTIVEVLNRSLGAAFGIVLCSYSLVVIGLWVVVKLSRPDVSLFDPTQPRMSVGGAMSAVFFPLRPLIMMAALFSALLGLVVLL